MFDPSVLAEALKQGKPITPQQQGGLPGMLPIATPPVNPFSNPLSAATGGLSGLFGR